jgi:hypothetical protein
MRWSQEWEIAQNNVDEDKESRRKHWSNMDGEREVSFLRGFERDLSSVNSST